MSEIPKDFVTASHAILFKEADSEACDVCGATLEAETDDTGEGYGVRGRGLFIWARGEERRYQEPPLCPSCAAAVGVSALSRWEIEEEEG